MLNMIFVIGFASYAIVYIAKYTYGPFNLFANIRRLVDLDLPVFAADGTIVDWIEDDNPTKFIPKLMSCFWCFTTWISFIITLIVIIIYNYNSIEFPLLWLASIGVSGAVYEISDC